MTPQVARTAVSLLTGDTLTGGTSAKVFTGTNWYGTNKSLIAGKTGTDIVQPDPTKPTELNTSFWFVGMTHEPGRDDGADQRVATRWPPITGIPGIPDAAAQTTADGSVAAQYWLTALGPTIKAGKWTLAVAQRGRRQRPGAQRRRADAAGRRRRR